LYLAGVDAKGIWVARSTNGGRTFTARTGVAKLPGSQAATCIVFGKFVLPQQAVRCLGPNPSISLSGNRVYVTYGVNGADLTFDVAIAVLDSSLRTLWQGPIATAKKKSDQFWPASTVDAKTGKVWACYYDTSGDSDRRHAWFTCTSSRNGRRWTKPVRAAPQSQNQLVLWEDARIAGYGDSGGWGGYVDVAAANGVVTPLWIDTHDVGGNQEEVFASVVR
ncbi:MAG: hypothetical protein ACJ74C_11355, partial [Gaiellaceae bacterium]